MSMNLKETFKFQEHIYQQQKKGMGGREEMKRTKSEV